MMKQALKSSKTNETQTDIISEVAPELSGMLRILTCGSVDDGKSTLIGRLLWDATDLYDDQRQNTPILIIIEYVILKFSINLISEI